MTLREKFICLLNNSQLKKADAIVLLQGDGLFRVPHVIKLFKQKLGGYIVLSGNADNPHYGSLPPSQIFNELIKYGIPEKNIIREAKSKNTREQAEEVMTIAKKEKWKKIILVASNFHQYRAFLTFLKVMKETNLKIDLINLPAQLPWFAENLWGKRFDLLNLEFDKIEKYIKLGHLVTYKDAIDYLKWKESKI